MKNFWFYLKLIAALGTLLVLITIGQSYLEYRSSRDAILSLFKNQSEIIISGIAKAGEKGLIAYQSLQGQVIHRLSAIAGSVAMLHQLKALNSTGLETIILENKLANIVVFDVKARPILYAQQYDGSEFDNDFIDSVLKPFIANDLKLMKLGFIEGIADSGKIFAILYKRHNDAIILIGTDAANLQNQRRAFGAGSIIEDMSWNEGIKYAGILNDGLIMVATKEFPIDQIDDWYSADNIGIDSIWTRIKSSKNYDNSGEDVFEAAGPFYVAGQYYGKIIVGLDTSILNVLTSKLKGDVVWHSVLGFLITLIAIIGGIIWNNYRIISKRYDDIKNEVRKLEADKAIKARLASMGELAGGVAHEVRNPLNAIRVIIQRLQREFEPKSDREEYADLTEVVKRETDRINESIKQFLKMARPPALEKTNSNLNTCIEGMLELFRPRAEQLNIKIITDLGRLPNLDLDTKLCGQAILNILENALHAIKDDGRITIRTYRDLGKIAVEIEDNGPGVPDELKSRIFDMYFTTKDSGTGMGLPSVLMTVKEHGGIMEVLDNPAGGAVFRLEFPIE